MRKSGLPHEVMGVLVGFQDPNDAEAVIVTTALPLPCKVLTVRM